MNAGELIATWQEIAKAPHGDGPYLYLQMRGGALPIGAVLRAGDNRPGLLVRFPAADAHLLPRPESGRGFSFEKPVQVGAGTLGLPILLGDPAVHDLFALMGADLVSEVERTDVDGSPVQRVLRRILLWRRFMQRRSGLLSPEEVRGLFAELNVLRRCMVADGTEAALEAWQGPARELQDFSFVDCLLEVKSWHAENGARVRISDPAQIVVDPVRQVFLVAVQLSLGPTGQTLPELVAELRRAMNGMQDQRFTEQLADYGFLDTHAANYRDRISVLGVEAFEVRDGFPHIDVRALPGGISMLRYSIELGAVEDFRTINRHLGT